MQQLVREARPAPTATIRKSRFQGAPRLENRGRNRRGQEIYYSTLALAFWILRLAPCPEKGLPVVDFPATHHEVSKIDPGPPRPNAIDPTVCPTQRNGS